MAAISPGCRSPTVDPADDDAHSVGQLIAAQLQSSLGQKRLFPPDRCLLAATSRTAAHPAALPSRSNTEPAARRSAGWSTAGDRSRRAKGRQPPGSPARRPQKGCRARIPVEARPRNFVGVRVRHFRPFGGSRRQEGCRKTRERPARCPALGRSRITTACLGSISDPSRKPENIWLLVFPGPRHNPPG